MIPAWLKGIHTDIDRGVGIREMDEVIEQLEALDSERWTPYMRNPPHASFEARKTFKQHGYDAYVHYHPGSAPEGLLEIILFGESTRACDKNGRYLSWTTKFMYTGPGVMELYNSLKDKVNCNVLLPETHSTQHR